MPDIFLLFSLILFGLIFGSFISAWSYRLIRNESIFNGRSFCDNCKKKIHWYDNIPVVSFYLLKGKSRCCKKTISIRYPIIEFFTMLTFLFTGISYLNCAFGNAPICVSRSLFGWFSIPYLLIISVFLITIFVTDFERKIILDELIFIPYVFALMFLVFINPDYLYTNIFMSFACATVFLLIHLATRGKGMGLGDVKFVILPPIILGWPYTLIWLFLSFVVGAFVGVVLIFFRKARFGKQIPFGPFLILSYFLTLFLGDKLLFLFQFPY